nr:transposon Ty3-G Gag-Pol polyprotein [Tanacetum cinerariifolium]
MSGKDLLDRDEALKQLKYHFQRAQASADKHHRDVEFSVGDWVFLKLRPHRQQSVVKRINQKPFPIIARVASTAYKLQLPESAKFVTFFMSLSLNEPLEMPLLKPRYHQVLKQTRLMMWNQSNV